MTSNLTEEVRKGIAGDETLAAMISRGLASNSGTAIQHKVNGGWKRLTFSELGEEVRSLARGLIALSVGHQDRVAILAETRPEWTILDFASLIVGAIVVPVYPSCSAPECSHVLGHSEASLVFCEDQSQVDKVSGIRAELPALRQVLAIDGEMEDVLSLASLREAGSSVGDDELGERVNAVSPEDLCTLIYTSGTTGRPKGCMMTHRNYRSNCAMCVSVTDLGPGADIYVFLPLAHAMARMSTFFAIDQGKTLTYWGGDLRLVPEEIKEIRPTHLPSAPRLFEKVYAAAVGSVGNSKARRRLMRWAIHVGQRRRAADREGRSASLRTRISYPVADRLVLSRIRNLFGGRIRLCLSGSAPIAPEILEFFDACGILIIEGYGLTEAGSATTVNAPDALRFGTVGRPLPGVQVTIADDGEILIAGPHVFRGYLKDPDATAAILHEGWLHSGDTGELDDDGFLSITGRKKDIIITSTGKNISPAVLETELRRIRWLSEAAVIGEGRPYLVAIVGLDPDEATDLAASAGCRSASIEDLASSPAVRALIETEIAAVNRAFAPVERIRDFRVADRPLTHEAGDLTPTLKLKRAAVEKAYRDLIESMYSGRTTPQAQGSA